MNHEDWLDELDPFLSGEVLNKNEESLTDEELAAAYAYLQGLERVIEDRKKTLRDRLLKIAVEGSSTEKGGFVSWFGGVKVVRERRVASAPDVDTIKGILEREHLAADACFSKKTTMVLDPSKLQHLISIGKLSESEIEQSKQVNLALKVLPSSDIELGMQEARQRYSQVFVKEITEAAIEKTTARRARPKKSVAAGPRKE